MYEAQTFETIMSRMLDRAPADIDKREGSIIYDAIAPAAIEIAQLYVLLDQLINNAYGDTAIREFLIRIAAARGIVPEEATNAKVLGAFTPTGLAIPLGSRWNCGEFNYVVESKVTDGQYLLLCETAGTAPNGNTGMLVPLDYLHGLTKAEIESLEIPGEDEESTETFRLRYLNSFSSESCGGNVAWYIEKVHALEGTGGCKVYRAWNGAGTVKLVITDSSHDVPSSTLISAVQTAIDPLINQGDGIGLAPIGHFVTVVGVTGQNIAISMKLTYESGYGFSSCQSGIEKAIDDYFLELSKGWENVANIIVRISQIETRILDVAGIIDCENVLLDGERSNCTVAADSIPKRGVLSETN